MAGKKHIHKYHKIKINAVDVWACALPNCSHYMPKHIESMVLGKASFCWHCNAQFILDENSMNMDKPICIKCAHPAIEPILDIKDKFKVDESNSGESLDKKLASILGD